MGGKIDELIKFVEMNQEPLVEIMSAMELPPEITEREVSYLKKWREELPEGTIYCSFCGKAQDDVKKMIAGPANCFICDECIEICNEIMEEEREREKQ